MHSYVICCNWSSILQLDEFAYTVVKISGTTYPWICNLVCAEFNLKNIKLYLHFLLFLLHSRYHGCWWPGDTGWQYISSHDIDLILPEYFNFSSRWINSSDAGEEIFWLWGSIPCLLMPWLLKSPEHQQAWYWPCRTDNMHCYSRVNFIYLGPTKSQISPKMWI